MKTSFSHLDQFRAKTTKTFYDTKDGERFGAFRVPYKGLWLIVICTPPAEENEDIPEAEGWEHISVHGTTRQKIGPNSEETYEMNFTPSWDQMCYIKNLFFTNEETVIQYHPARSEYVNEHPNTLHLWRPTKVTIPLPPKILV